MPKTAFITGITGQDGAYLAELLIDKGYTVHAMIRRSSSFNTGRVNNLYKDPHIEGRRLVLHYGDMTDASSLIRLMQAVRPDEVYNLAAQSHVWVSFETPEYTANADALGALRILDAIKSMPAAPQCIRFLQASSSELYGDAQTPTQDEKTPFLPRSPYASSKLFAYWTTVNYREAFGLHASNSIAFNHESPIRGKTFVSRKITLAAANIKCGHQDSLYLGNLNAQRDWGHARDYVLGMWAMLQRDKPDDYVLATGETHSVREFCECAFAEVGITLRWQGSGIDEKGIDTRNNKPLIHVDPVYFRPTEVNYLCGNASKAHRELGWKHTVGFRQLVREMVAADMEKVQQGHPSFI